jgi:hypothetical protein
MKSAATSNREEADFRILKIAHCPSLSGKSKLTYQIGSAGKDDVRFRVVSNSAAGCFNPDWVTYESIEEAFAKCRKGEPVTAVVLDHLFRGKSLNTPFFLFAALKNEGLVKDAADGKRGYERVEPKAFVTGMQELIRSKAAPVVDDKAGKKKTSPPVESKKALKAKKKSAAL